MGNGTIHSVHPNMCPTLGKLNFRNIDMRTGMDLIVNAHGLVDIYFGPTPPAGAQIVSWLQCIN